MANSILFSTSCLHNENSGITESLKQTVFELNNRGNLISVIGNRNRAHKSVLHGWSCEVHAFQRFGPGFLRCAPSMHSWLHQQSPRWDIVSMQEVWLPVNHTLASWCMQYDTPFMMTTHGSLNPTAMSFSSWKKCIAVKTFMAKVFRHMNCYQALTAAEYTTLRQFGITAPICVIGNGINLPDYSALIAPDLILPQAFLKRRTCLYLGRLHPIKGLERLITAWGKLRPSDDWQLIIAGSGSPSYESNLKNLAVHSKSENLHFIGAVHGHIKSAWLQQADFMVLPSHSEAFPMSVLEGLSFGRPCLLTNQCRLPEAQNAGAAIEVSSTEEHIIEGLQLMLGFSEEHLRNMGRCGLQLINERYTWSKITTELESVYRWLKGSDVIPDCVEMT